MDLKIRLVADWLTGRYTVTELGRSYAISRKTVYKWLARYEQQGASGLEERSRAPQRCPHAVSAAMAQRIIEVKRQHLSFGPKKVMDLLRAQEPSVDWPADSTAGEVLKRAGLVKKRRSRRPYPADPQPFHLGESNNALWSVDYKGQYRSQRGRWCYPLTITDNASRYLIGCQRVSATDYAQARPVFEWAFREYGLPEGILSDNGSPFASRAAGGLTRLSLWWVLQGIRVHRIQPGKPTQNARHERLHGTLHRAIGERLQGANEVQQQKELTAFTQEYNLLRSHESLGRRPPASLYTPSVRKYTALLAPIAYEEDQLVRSVRHKGEIKLKGGLIYIGELFAKHPVGLREVDNDRYEVRLSFHLLGHINLAVGRLEKATQWHSVEPEQV